MGNKHERWLKLILSLLLALSLFAVPGTSGSAETGGIDGDGYKSYFPIVTKPYPAPLSNTTGATYYVAPDGSSSGNGSISRPWDLESALSGSKPVHPSDVILLREGTYNYRHLSYLYSHLKGASGRPITVRAYPGEHAAIDAALVVRGEWTIFWGLEFTDSEPERVGVERKDAVAVWGPNCWLINNVIHDASGVSLWWQAVNAGMYGNLVYNHGYYTTDRTHGHNLYTTNQTGVKQINDNIILNSVTGYNIHAYSENTYLNGFHMEGNVLLNGYMLVGGKVPATNIEAVNNFFYRSPAWFGYTTSVLNQNLLVKGNHFDSVGEDALLVLAFNNFSITNNFFRGQGANVGTLSAPSSHGPYVWNQNTYFSDDDRPFSINGSSRTWTQWRSAGFDSSSSLNASGPGGVEVFVRPNRYEEKRAHIIIYNWDMRGEVGVDLASVGFKPGDTYVLHNAQNYYAETIQGQYTGQPIVVPMSGWSVAVPVGMSAPLYDSTFPQFGVFIIDTE